VTYQCQYITPACNISECNYKCETQNTEPEIETDGYSQTGWNPQVDRHWSVYSPPIVSWAGFWTGPDTNQVIFAVHTQNAGGLPRPIANTTYMIVVEFIFNQIFFTAITLG
jgi:hypothetical protein